MNEFRLGAQYENCTYACANIMPELASPSRLGVRLSLTPYLLRLGRKSSDTTKRTFLAPGGAGAGGLVGGGVLTSPQGLHVGDGLLSVVAVHGTMELAEPLR